MLEMDLKPKPVCKARYRVEQNVQESSLG